MHESPRARRSAALSFVAALGCNVTIPDHAPPPAKPEPPPAPAKTEPPAKPDLPARPPAIAPDILAAAEKARGTAAGKQQAADRLRAGVTGDELWGAVYVYSTDGDDPALLTPLLAGGDATIRVLAAGGLLRMGDRAGFAALIAETANPAVLAGSEPPQTIGEVAAILLKMASGQPIGLAPTPENQQAWRAWYAASADALEFDPKLGWSVP